MSTIAVDPGISIVRKIPQVLFEMDLAMLIEGNRPTFIASSHKFQLVSENKRLQQFHKQKAKDDEDYYFPHSYFGQ